VAYKTEIQIGVKGADRLRELQRQIEKVSNAIDLLGARDLFENKALQSIDTYNRALKESSRNLQAVKLGTLEETKAIKLYVDALGQANQAQSRQNAQIEKEIALRERAARIRQLPPTQATTQFDAPIGPQQASFLTGISSPVAGRIQDIKTAQAAMVAAELEVDRTRRAFEVQFTQTQIKNDELITKKKIDLLDKETKRAMDNSKRENDAALKDFDQRLATRDKARQRQAQRSQRLESLALGVGFPLLFGGGAGQALGGLAGSFQGTGFGGQIIGSAIGGAIEDFISSAAQLGNALNEITPDMERLAEAIGAVGNEEGRRLELLEELQGETVAFNAAQKELAVLIGQGGINALKDLGSETVELSNQFNRFITIVQAGLAGLINSAGILSGLVGTVSRAVAARQAETSQDPRLVALRQERESLGGGFGAVGRELEIRRKMIDVQMEINKGRAEEFKIQLQNLETDFKAKQAKIEQAKIDRENARIAREDHALRVTDLRVQQSGIQTQINQLANEEKIFQIRQQTAASTVELERARFDAQLSTLQLQEAGLQRELEGLQKKEFNLQRQLDIIDAIAENQIRQAEIQNEVAKLQNAQGIAQAKIAQQQIQFEVQRIKLQLQMVQLKAQEIKDDEQRAAKIREIAATEQQVLALTKEMVSAGNKRLETAIKIARQKDIVADNILKGKLQSIEAERVEARRAARAAQLAKATGEAADEAARLNRNMSKGSGGLGKKTTQTVSTSIPIDPDVQQSVIDRAGPFGFRGRGAVSEMIRQLEMAQKAKNARTAKEAQMSQPSSSSFASSSSYGARSSSSSGSGTATVNVKTGPVMQVENKRYVSMEDFESGLREVARSTAQTSRSYGSRRYSGIGR